MVTAATAWELAEASGGRFRLGLGAQVRAHILRRYGSEFDPPGPRLREYVLAVKQIFESFRNGEPLAVEGEFYNLSLLPPTWAPGAIDVRGPARRRRRGQPLDAAHGRRGGRRRARAPAQHAHLPARDRAAQPGGRRRPLRAPRRRPRGDRPRLPRAWATPSEERSAWREMARVQVAFYGSTPNYAFIFEQLDREGTTELIRERQRAGDIPGMAAVIDDDLLENFIDRRHLGRHRRRDRGEVRRGGDPGRQLLHRVRRRARPRCVRALGPPWPGRSTAAF